MRVGLESFTIHELKLDPFSALEFVKGHNLSGLQGGLGHFGSGADIGRMREIKAYADSLDLYTEATVGCANPFVAGKTREEQLALMQIEIENASACGWHELHTWTGGPDARARTDIAWADQLSGTQTFLAALTPILIYNGSRLNIEPKGGVSTFDAVRLVEAIAPDVVGVCFDVANCLCFAEEPLAAAKRVAPYTHMTHCKDAIVFPYDTGIRRQVRPCGEGVVEWNEVLRILGEHSPQLTLSIEDHKWLFDIPIDVSGWRRSVPGLSQSEVDQTKELASQCQARIDSEDLSDPESYEAIPFLDQLTERLHSSRDTLNGTIAELGLE